jgi:hypothetical protein
MALRTTGSNGASERLVHDDDDDALLADIDAELARVRSALGSPALTR